jgi:hypothetical protein
VTPFDIKTIICGDQDISGRPIDWKSPIIDADGNDESGEMAQPTLYQGTCPHCGNLVEFAFDLIETRCPNCEVGKDAKFHREFENPFIPVDGDAILAELLGGNKTNIDYGRPGGDKTAVVETSISKDGTRHIDSVEFK